MKNETTLHVKTKIKHKLKTVALKKKITLQRLVEIIFQEFLKGDKKIILRNTYVVRKTKDDTFFVSDGLWALKVKDATLFTFEEADTLLKTLTCDGAYPDLKNVWVKESIMIHVEVIL